jgi:threonine/homoserine/homoserine lactone efflux protein
VIFTPFLVGLALGAVSTVPPGPCQLAVIDAAARGARRGAIAVALGAAAGDALCGGLALHGIAALLAQQPALTLVFRLISATTLLTYGLGRLMPPRGVAGPRPRVAGFGVGLGLVAANPTALLAWVMTLGVVAPHAGRFEAAWTIAGIFAGSAAGYSTLARLCAPIQGWGARLRVVSAGAVALAGAGSLAGLTLGRW